MKWNKLEMMLKHDFPPIKTILSKSMSFMEKKTFNKLVIHANTYACETSYNNCGILKQGY